MAGFAVLNPAGLARLDAIERQLIERITREVAEDARRGCPVDTGELVSTIDSQMVGDTGFVFVGSDHWHETEYGSHPHEIRVRTKQVLYNAETSEFFGTRVWHPGTPEQAFMRPALYRHRAIRDVRLP